MAKERTLNVYCWGGRHPDAPGLHKEVRFYVAARSKAEARELAGNHRVPASQMATILCGDGWLTAQLNPRVLIWETRYTIHNPCPHCDGTGRIPRPKEFHAASGDEIQLPMIL
jgi:hypothetical protein